MTQSLNWTPLTRKNIELLSSHRGLAKILAVRRDGRGYFGSVSSVTPEYVELRNGDFHQNVYFAGPPTVYAVIEEPPAPSYKLGDRRLPLERTDG